MYLLFKHKNIMPHEYKKIKQGEKIILAAFIEKLIEEDIEKQEYIGNMIGL